MPVKVKAAIMIVGIALIGFTLFLVHEPVLSRIGDFLVIRDELQPADLIHVIAGPDEFTDYAIQLYKGGYGKKLFFTGVGWCDEHAENHGERWKEKASRRGVPQEAMVLDDSLVTSTYSEVVRLKAFINRSEEPIRSVTSVSYPHHMRRARWTYHRILGDNLELHMAPIPFQLSPHKHYWWLDSKSRQMVKNEYLKIVYYYARYKFARGWVREWLEGFDRK